MSYVANYLGHKLICPRCGEFEWLEPLRYGATDYRVYRIGDRILWTTGPDTGGYIQESWVRDSRLKRLGGGAEVTQCPKCKAWVPAPFVLIIDGDVLKSVFMLPPLHGIPGGKDGRGYQFRGFWNEVELMLLVEGYGGDRVADTFKRLLLEMKGGRLPEIPEPSIKGTEEEVRKSHEDAYAASRREYPRELKLKYRGRVLNTLANRGPELSAASDNVLQHEVACPGCGKKESFGIPLAYGSCNGYQYRLGDKVDWEKMGRIPCVRDPILQYVRVELPPCPRCGYRGLGYVTVGEDRIESVYVFAKEIHETISRPQRGFTRYEEVEPWDYREPWDFNLFLLTRHYGEQAVKDALLVEDPPLGIGNLLAERETQTLHQGQERRG